MEQMEETTEASSAFDYLRANSDQVLAKVSEYGYLVSDGLFFILAGTLAVYLLHKLAARFLLRYVNNKRMLMVTFGTLYVLVLVVTVILVLGEIGFDASSGGSIAILVVIFLAVVLYFIIPFLPKLPFMPGHMIEAYGVMGTVEAVSTFHTTVRKFDGTIVFLPNAMIMATKILNYSYLPNRRIEMKLSVDIASDLDTVKARLLAVADNERRVLADPPPAVFAMNADASGVELMLYCWVENADFLGTRSDLWKNVLQLVTEDSAISLALPQQGVLLREEF
jgi:small conductance mechanosensitive channel